MPTIEGVKYACAACIKGHRSSSCQHADRPIFEIKRKGRPPTQCSKCRQTRKNTGAHVKCLCKQDKPVIEELPKPDGPNFKALRAIHRATLQRAYKCQCMTAGSCACPAPDASPASDKKRPLESTPSASPSSSSRASPWNDPKATAYLNLPQPSIPLPQECATGLWPEDHDAKPPLLFNDWVFGDVMLPESFFPPPVPSALLAEGACSSCGSTACKCGESCHCPEVQALHQSLLFDSPAGGPGSTLNAAAIPSQIDQAFLDSILGTSTLPNWPSVPSEVPDWQQGLPLATADLLPSAPGATPFPSLHEFPLLQQPLPAAFDGITFDPAAIVHHQPLFAGPYQPEKDTFRLDSAPISQTDRAPAVASTEEPIRSCCASKTKRREA